MHEAVHEAPQVSPQAGENEEKDEKTPGIAGMFSRTERKTFFINYLIIMMVIEGLIFFVSFVSHLAGEVGVFPWKPYMFAALLTPVAITFVFGLITLAFNQYFLQTPPAHDGVDSKVFKAGPASGSKLQTFFDVIHRVPFLLSMLMLMLMLGVVYKMDAITLFIAQTGERATRYLLISGGVLLAVAAVLILTWLLLSYHLRKKKLALSYEYRRDVMERTGMVILDDETVLDREGRPVELPARGSSGLPGTQKGGMKVLPPLAED